MPGRSLDARSGRRKPEQDPAISDELGELTWRPLAPQRAQQGADRSLQRRAFAKHAAPAAREAAAGQAHHFELSALQRLLLSGRVVAFYLGKLVVPSDLTFIYPRWTIDPTDVSQWAYPIVVLVVLGAALWLALHEAGVHATIAGVVLGLATLVVIVA